MAVIGSQSRGCCRRLASSRNQPGGPGPDRRNSLELQSQFVFRRQELGFAQSVAPAGLESKTVRMAFAVAAEAPPAQTKELEWSADRRT
jgi:hypothetical protein